MGPWAIRYTIPLFLPRLHVPCLINYTSFSSFCAPSLQFYTLRYGNGMLGSNQNWLSVVTRSCSAFWPFCSMARKKPS